MIAFVWAYTDSVEEAAGLAKALALIKELLCSVDQQVLELERTQRLQEIRSRLDPRAEAKLRSGSLFRPAELLRRQLIYEGTLLWKTPSSRLKGTLQYYMHSKMHHIFRTGVIAILKNQ